MENHNFGVQTVKIHLNNYQHSLFIEVYAQDRRTRLMIDGVFLHQVYDTPEDAYKAAIKLLKLTCQKVTLGIDVACNVMDVADVANLFTAAGVKVTQVTAE